MKIRNPQKMKVSDGYDDLSWWVDSQSPMKRNLLLLLPIPGGLLKENLSLISGHASPKRDTDQVGHIVPIMIAKALPDTIYLTMVAGTEICPSAQKYAQKGIQGWGERLCGGLFHR
jgi:hypothetical protein